MRDACAQVRELRGPWGVRGRHAQVRDAEGSVGSVREACSGEGCSGGRGVCEGGVHR